MISDQTRGITALGFRMILRWVPNVTGEEKFLGPVPVGDRTWVAQVEVRLSNRVAIKTGFYGDAVRVSDFDPRTGQGQRSFLLLLHKYIVIVHLYLCYFFFLYVLLDFPRVSKTRKYLLRCNVFIGIRFGTCMYIKQKPKLCSINNKKF